MGCNLLAEREAFGGKGSQGHVEVDSKTTIKGAGGGSGGKVKRTGEKGTKCEGEGKQRSRERFTEVYTTKILGGGSA